MHDETTFASEYADLRRARAVKQIRELPQLADTAADSAWWDAERNTGIIGQLRHVTAMHGSLAMIQDELVAAMRAGGYSWRHIGDALGVTPQAAQQKYTHRIAEV